jgi:hypothetical protein
VPVISEGDGKTMLGLSFGGRGGKFLSLPRAMVCGLWGRGEIDLEQDTPELEGGMKFRSPISCCCCGSVSCSEGAVITKTEESLIAGGILRLTGLGRALEGAVGGEVGVPLKPCWLGGRGRDFPGC